MVEQLRLENPHALGSYSMHTSNLCQLCLTASHTQMVLESHNPMALLDFSDDIGLIESICEVFNNAFAIIIPLL